MLYDVVIIGAGPAGLFAGYEIGSKERKVLIVEKGKDLDERTPKDVMSGVGGAGTFSDGTVNLRPDIGGIYAIIQRTIRMRGAWSSMYQMC